MRHLNPDLNEDQLKAILAKRSCSQEEISTLMADDIAKDVVDEVFDEADANLINEKVDNLLKGMASANKKFGVGAGAKAKPAATPPSGSGAAASSSSGAGGPASSSKGPAPAAPDRVPEEHEYVSTYSRDALRAWLPNAKGWDFS